MSFRLDNAGAIEATLAGQSPGRTIDDDVAESGATGCCLAALRRFGPHGVDMPGSRRRR
jgi:hypothetical protein